MDAFSNKDIKCLEEAYNDVKLYNEGLWDRVKAGAKGLAASTKVKMSNANKFSRNVARNIGNAAKGLAGDNNALNRIRDNNTDTSKTYNSAGAAAMNAKQQSIIKSHKTKIDNEINRLYEMVQDFNKDLIGLKISNNPVIGGYTRDMYQQLQQLAQKCLNSVNGYETPAQQNAEDEELFY